MPGISLLSISIGVALRKLDRGATEQFGRELAPMVAPCLEGREGVRTSELEAAIKAPFISRWVGFAVRALDQAGLPTHPVVVFTALRLMAKRAVYRKLLPVRGYIVERELCYAVGGLAYISLTGTPKSAAVIARLIMTHARPSRFSSFEDWLAMADQHHFTWTTGINVDTPRHTVGDNTIAICRAIEWWHALPENALRPGGVYAGLADRTAAAARKGAKIKDHIIAEKCAREVMDIRLAMTSPELVARAVLWFLRTGPEADTHVERNLARAWIARATPYLTG